MRIDERENSIDIADTENQVKIEAHAHSAVITVSSYFAGEYNDVVEQTSCVELPDNEMKALCKFLMKLGYGE